MPSQQATLSRIKQHKALIFEGKNRFIKIAYTPPLFRKLRNESRMTLEAAQSPLYQTLTPTLICHSPLWLVTRKVSPIKDIATLTEGLKQLWTHQAELLTNTPRCNLPEAAIRFGESLGKNRQTIEKILSSESNKDPARIQIPITFMHGDLGLSNFGQKDNGELCILDWEAASTCGTILYDWYYFITHLRMLAYHGKMEPALIDPIDNHAKALLSQLNLSEEHFGIIGSIFYKLQR